MKRGRPVVHPDLKGKAVWDAAKGQKRKRYKEELQMSPSTITLLFLAFAVVMFVLEKIPLGLTSMIVCIGLVLTGVLDAKTAFSGFIDSNVILFVSMFIVGGALFETGMANKVGLIVSKFAKSERMLIVAIMVIVGLMSGVLSNTGTAADPGCDRNRCKIRIQKIPSADAAGICSCHGRKPLPDRSTG